ncbi:hypothetical protein Hanom_Chr14g01298481 [Helianthus anomalus]
MEHVKTVDLPYFLKLRTLLPQMSLFQRHKPTRNHRLALFYTYSCQSSRIYCIELFKMKKIRHYKRWQF